MNLALHNPYIDSLPVVSIRLMGIRKKFEKVYIFFVIYKKKKMSLKTVF